MAWRSFASLAAIFIVASAGCRGARFTDADRRDFQSGCMRDFASQPFCDCGLRHIEEELAEAERARPFWRTAKAPDVKGSSLRAFRQCSHEVTFSELPPASVRGIKSRCKGGPEDCACLAEIFKKKVSFADLESLAFGGKGIEELPGFKAAVEEVAERCPLAFVERLPGDAWPDDDMEKFVARCREQMDPVVCRCLYGRVQKAFGYTEYVRLALKPDESFLRKMEQIRSHLDRCASEVHAGP